MYLIITFDATSTQENPIAPVEKIAKNAAELCDHVNEFVDNTHYCVVRFIDSI